MTTFAQWRSPSPRLAAAAAEGHARKYDMRIVDHFHAYCSSIARADRHREAATRSQHATKHQIWAILIATSVLGYYLLERVAQAMSLY